ncbi:M23 family metallopeptidase [Thiomicrorhabdus sp. 6S3-12]|uniref:M23 family metallopeptidase n=1 Tax=Thiomicrorhabdus sp. 6S3-12 TaxID=2819681 RepID=UPI001AADE563|nr:peptidoglycan DD-metalloendopeptidase family protein [Thiomicrorhabdus sp. 6S3-12]MBO1923508.1 peptidoglycan DD-metalloendopeptidase family protein [Thiomicrorhabdus sp. 6S3-12]
MRNRFTVTVSDVHGARHYSFTQLAKRFFSWILLLFLTLWVAGALTIVWFSNKVDEVEAQHRFAVKAYSDRLAKVEDDYENMLTEKGELETALNQKSERLDSLGQTLQNIEEMIMTQDELQSLANLPVEQRLENLQMSALERSLMLASIPNGSAVKNFNGFTSYYGVRKHPVTGVRSRHLGIDYRGGVGEDVLATADGIVSFSAFSKETGFGNLVSIIHANGFKSRYGHLHKRTVKVGDYVYKGQKIGEIGNTGRSTGPHLHYEVLFLSRRIDPKPFHEWSQENYNAIFQEVKLVPWGSLVQAASLQAKKVEKQLLPRDVAFRASLPN